MFRRIYFTLIAFFSTHLLLCKMVELSARRRLTFKLGGFFPMTSNDGNRNESGAQYLAAFMMAVNELNNKSDSIGDDLLPNLFFQIALSDTEGDYVNTFNSAYRISTLAFNSTGIDGCIGPATNVEAEAVTSVFNEFKTTYISYASTASYLSYVNAYPYYVRTSFSDAYQSIAIANIIHDFFNWKKVITFSNADTFGGDLLYEFNTAAADIGITILNSIQFRHGVRDLSDTIKQAKGFGARIFVLLIEADDAGRLLEQGHEAGLFPEGTQIFGTSFVSVQDTLKSMSSTADVSSIMKGYLGVTPHFSLDTTLGKAFVKRWRNQRSTMQVFSNGSVYCDKSRDDTGEYIYYNRGKYRNECIGLDFHSFSTDGTDIANYAPYAYDATYELAHALHYLIYGKNQTNFNGNDIGAAIVSNGSFLGVTGRVNALNGDPSTGYRYGDRQAGAKYSLLNYKNGNFTRVGVWTVADGLTLCSDVSCTIKYNTNDNSQPYDSPLPIYAVMSDATKIVLYIMSSLCLLVVLTFFIMVRYYLHHRIIKAAQPSMMMVILLGGLLGGIKVISTALTISNSVCIAGTWLGHLAFGMVFFALLTKTWRVHLIVNSAFRRIKITSSLMNRIVTGMILLLCFYLVLFTFFGQPYATYTSTVDLERQITYYITCTSKLSSFSIILYVVETLMLAQGVRLCWVTRNIPDAVNESKSIAIAMYAIVSISVLVFPIVTLISLEPAVTKLIIGFGFAMATLISMLALFLPKALLLLRGADLDAHFQIIMPKVLSADVEQDTGKSVLLEKNNHPNLESKDNEYPDPNAIKLITNSKLSKAQKSDICREQIEIWQKLKFNIEDTRNIWLIRSDDKTSSATQASRSIPLKLHNNNNSIPAGSHILYSENSNALANNNVRSFHSSATVAGGGGGGGGSAKNHLTLKPSQHQQYYATKRDVNESVMKYLPNESILEEVLEKEGGGGGSNRQKVYCSHDQGGQGGGVPGDTKNQYT